MLNFDFRIPKQVAFAAPYAVAVLVGTASGQAKVELYAMQKAEELTRLEVQISRPAQVSFFRPNYEGCRAENSESRGFRIKGELENLGTSAFHLVIEPDGPEALETMMQNRV